MDYGVITGHSDSEMTDLEILKFQPYATFAETIFTINFVKLILFQLLPNC